MYWRTINTRKVLVIQKVCILLVASPSTKEMSIGDLGSLLRVHVKGVGEPAFPWPVK